MLEGYSWDMIGYIPKYGFQCLERGMTLLEAERTFQLEPEPPQVASINEYIVLANREKELRYLCFFLHHYEKMLDGRIYRVLRRNGDNRYDPERLLNYKMECLSAFLDCLPGYDPTKGADFLTYAHHFIGNAILNCRRYEEAASFKSLHEYKAVRHIAWLYNSSEKSEEKTIRAFTDEYDCTEKLAKEYLTAARRVAVPTVPLTITVQDEDSEETGEDVIRDDHWNYVDILWNGIQAETIQRAFEKLDYREQTLLEKRLSICMTCGRVGSWQDRPIFEELAVMFEGSTASGAERAYRKAVDKLTELLVAEGALHAIRLKQKSQTRRRKRITAAIYEYQVDCDGEWGEISFDFEHGTVEISRLADWDTIKTNRFAKIAIAHLQNSADEGLQKNCIVLLE